MPGKEFAVGDSEVMSSWYPEYRDSQTGSWVDVYTAHGDTKWSSRVSSARCIPRASNWDEHVRQYDEINRIIWSMVGQPWKRSKWNGKGPTTGTSGAHGRLFASVSICGEEGTSLVFTDLVVSPTPPQSMACTLSVPEPTAIVFRDEQVIHRDVTLSVMCDGGASGSAKLSLRGSNTVSPAQGVEVVIDGPFDVPLPMAAGVNPVTLGVRVSRDDGALPGVSNVSYVVVLDML